MRASYADRSTAPPPPHTSGIDLAEVTRCEVDLLERDGDPPLTRATVTFRGGTTKRLHGRAADALVEAVREEREAEGRWVLACPVYADGQG